MYFGQSNFGLIFKADRPAEGGEFLRGLMIGKDL